MKPVFPALAALIILGSTASAANSFSFTVRGHRVRIEAPPHCRSASCLSISIPGIYERGGRDRYDDDRDEAASAPPPAQALGSTVAPARKPVSSAVCAPSVPAPSAAVTTQQVVTALQPLPRIQPPQTQPPQPPPPQAQPALVQPAQVQPPQIQPVTTATITPPPQSPVIARPADVAAPEPAPRVATVSHEVDEEPDDSPIGDWQTQGEKGMVRIEPCGQALCGYALDPSSNAKGETVLVDMKAKSSSEWSGNIYSRDSGNSYYGKMSMKGPNSLKVEACAFGRFFCSGNIWNRADIKPVRVMSDRRNRPESRS